MKRLFIILPFICLLTISWAQNKSAQPTFPGGQNAFYKFLVKNLKMPDPQLDVQGKILISFFVEKDGRLTDIKVIKHLYPSFDAEALRVIKLSPRWVPAKLHGKPVRARFIVPITFRMDN